MSVITKAQDKFFKSVFSRKEIVIELFQKTLSEQVLPKLNLSELELVSGSFVDNKLKEHFADLVYRCPLTDQGEVQLVLLLEHKSYQEPYPHFQLLQYVLGLWNQNIKQQQKPVFVIPIVFYHGKTNWNYQPMQDYFQGIPTPLLRYLPLFDYDLIDLLAMSDSQIDQFRNGFLAVSTFLFKHRHQSNYIKVFEREFVELMKRIDFQTDEGLVETLLLYIQQTNDLAVEELLFIFEKISNETKEKAMSTYERAINQGRDEANFEAIKNLIKDGVVTDVERLRTAFKLSKKKMSEFLKRIEAEK
ncbi:MAG: Rpn family recombination-promoting nuclease/putative transposase [Spirosomataceae bacterium]